MADYYPLIARAIAGLDPSAPGESRRALYERARAALIAQLRSVEPPLSESEITRERLSLEEAVRKVESEAAQRARDATRSGGGGAARSGAPAPATRSAPTPGRLRGPAETAAPPSAPLAGAAHVSARRPGRARPRRPRATTGRRSGKKIAPPAQFARRSIHAVAAAAAGPDAGCRRCRRPANDGRAAPWPRQQRAAGAGHARVSRYRRRRRRSRPRRGAGQPRRRGKPMPTCRRPRRNSTGSSRAWKTAAPIRTRPIPMTNRSQEAERYAPPPQAPRSRVSQDRPRAEEARRAAARRFRSRARSPSAWC